MNRCFETTPEHVSLRLARSDDQTFLFEVYASTRIDELTAAGWDEQQQQAFLQMQFQAQDKHYRENYPGAEFYIVQVDGQRAGRLYVHNRDKEIRIMDIALLPTFRQQGTGSILLQTILCQAANTGRTVSIHVEVFNPALLWYEKLGFKKAAEYGPYHLMEWAGTPISHPSKAGLALRGSRERGTASILHDGGHKVTPPHALEAESQPR